MASEDLDSLAQSIIDNINNSPISESEKFEAIKVIKALYSKKKKTKCDTCQNWVLSVKSCEFCIAKFLEKNFRKSGDDDYDKLLKAFHKSDTVKPELIIEWIPYDKLQNVQYTTEGGFYKIFRALWSEGRYISWDMDRQKLKRMGSQPVTIKYINSVAPHRYNEINAHLTLSMKNLPVILAYGLTKDPESGNYMIVMESVECNLRSYLQDSIENLTWLQKYKILLDISLSLECVHDNQLIHRDLHPGNIMCSDKSESWLIGDFGLCSSTPTKEFHGILPFIAPEIHRNRNEPITMKSDIYSFAMIMWEVSTGYQPPNRPGTKPDVMEETPEHYEELMKNCWDDDPENRPDIKEIIKEIKKIVENSEDKEISEKYKLKGKKYLQIVVGGKKEKKDEGKVNEGIVQPVKNPPIKIITKDQIGEEVISDGIGVVSQASMSIDGTFRRVAIKSFQIDKSNESKNLSFLKTLQTKINEMRDQIYNHPNIVEFLGVGIRDENKLFLVMPFADGDDLRTYYRGNKLPFNKKIGIMKGIADGIKTLHEYDIIHENINPENILIFGDGLAKISNLPLLYNNTDLYFKNKEFYFDEKLFENIGYVDPNTITECDKYIKNKSVDIYSLGTLLWEIISEKVPYLEEQNKKSIQKIIFEIVEGHREVDIKNAPDEYIELYKNCWDKVSSKRPEIDDVCEQLSNF